MTTAPLHQFEIDAVRAEFPILSCSSRGKPLIYLDSGATAQKPQAVIDATSRFYSSGNANIHRGVYQFSEEATIAYDGTRETVARFLGGVRPEEVVFVRGTTEALNLVANSYLQPRLKAGDHVLVTAMEHHANIVPWQLVGAATRAIPLLEDGSLDLDAARRMLADGPVLLAVAHVSNVLGTVNPIAELAAMAQAEGVPVVVDGAQAVSHLPIDIPGMGIDFYAFSAHKLYGPTGTGVLWGKQGHLSAMQPWQGGGDMIDLVTFERTTFAPPPHRFEAGTPDIAGVIGMRAAIEWLSAQDRVGMAAHEHEVLSYGMERLVEVPGLRLIGTAVSKISALAFSVEGVHPHDMASLLDTQGICVRAGHHCTQPLHRVLGLTATTRATVACHTTISEIEALVQAVRKGQELFA